MKKLLALMITLTLVLSCLPGTAAAEKYKSQLLKKTLSLPRKIVLADEQMLSDGSGVQLTFVVQDQANSVIYTNVTKVKEFAGYTVSTLPDSQLDAWTESYYQYYPENATAGRLQSNSGNGDALYCYSGQQADGTSLLVYASVKDQIYVTSYSISAGGFTKANMQGILETLNAVNAAFGKSSAGGSASAVYYHDDYDFLITYLLIADAYDCDLYDDDDFDWDYDDWDDEDDWDEYSDYTDWDDYGDYTDYTDYSDYSDYGDYGYDGYDDSGYDDGGYDDYGGYDDWE